MGDVPSLENLMIYRDVVRREGAGKGFHVLKIMIFRRLDDGCCEGCCEEG